MTALRTSASTQPEQARGLFGLPVALSKIARAAARVLSYVIGAVLVCFVLLVAVAAVPTLFGYHTYVVRGGSMEPALRTGSVAVTSPIKPIGLKVGDIIAYHPSTGSSHVLHRIIKIEEVNGERRYITQGDQNVAPDPNPVTLEGEGDRVVYSVPYAGYVVAFAQGWGGRFLLIGAPAILLAFMMGRDARRQPAGPAEAEVNHPPGEQATAPASTGPLAMVRAPRPSLEEQAFQLGPGRAPPAAFPPDGRRSTFTNELPVFRRVPTTPEERCAA
jgi:signal peptidase